MRQSDILINREASWLEFNLRVLEEAQDKSNPLLERLRFYCIFHSNLDEFFMVRVASLQHLIEQGDNNPDPAGLNPRQQLDLIFPRVRKFYEAGYELYSKELIPALAKEKIFIRSLDQIKAAQEKFLDDFFDRAIYPVLTPIAVDESHSSTWVPGLTSNLAVLLQPENGQETELKLAVVQIPGMIPGLIRLPDNNTLEMLWLNDAVRRRISSLFPGYRVLETAGFRLTRYSELELDDEARFDYIGILESELKKRKKAKPIRLEHEAMSAELLQRVQTFLDVEDSTMISIKGPLDPKPLSSVVDMPGYERLRYRLQQPLLRPDFEQSRPIFEVLRERDILLLHPYDSFDPVVRFIQASAEDPDVLAIKQTLYRTSGNESPIVNALVRAAENGKQVTVLVELTARFDEERNISWARGLEEAGAHVLYGLANLKMHAKVALVVRRELSGICRYVHLGTGNYNERTARLYTDFGFFTCNEEFGSDVSAFFNTITGYSEPPLFSRLVMAPIGMREKLIALIRRESDRARSGQHSEILAKMNSLVDPKLIRELYSAGKAGVKIQLNVRGICCLRPDVPGLSENIRVISILDRYLEHSRAFVFHNGGESEVFLSSADWMPRNLDKRVELMFPIQEESLKKRVIEILRAQMADNQKARLLLPDGSYLKPLPNRSEPLRVQEYLYFRGIEEQERARALTPVRFVPIEGRNDS
jgi:polyphosphate kinase